MSVTSHIGGVASEVAGVGAGHAHWPDVGGRRPLDLVLQLQESEVVVGSLAVVVLMHDDFGNVRPDHVALVVVIVVVLAQQHLGRGSNGMINKGAR